MTDDILTDHSISNSPTSAESTVCHNTSPNPPSHRHSLSLSDMSYTSKSPGFPSRSSTCTSIHQQHLHNCIEHAQCCLHKATSCDIQDGENYPQMIKRHFPRFRVCNIRLRHPVLPTHVKRQHLPEVIAGAASHSTAQSQVRQT
jgi:hypothetical protein